jgi:two-component system, NarL family, invasion response regulator UvrY
MDLIVCDDHPVVRAGLIRIMSEGFTLTSVREADNGQALLDLVRQRPGDVVLLDIGLPGRSGLDLLPQLKSERPRLPVLILSMHSADRYAVRALQAGASGYLTKGAVDTELVKAVTTVLNGHKYVTPEVAESLADGLNRGGAERPRHDALTVREFEVMSQLAAGRSVNQIAADLCLSYNTISTYRARVLRKLGVRSTAELMRYALQHGLTE